MQKKESLEKQTLIKLYEKSLNDVIWTHKTHATLLDNLNMKNKFWGIVKEIIIGLSSFVSVVFLYFEIYTGALITSAVTTLSLVFDSIFKFSDYANKIKVTSETVNELWYMKEKLFQNKLYLKSDIIDFQVAKNELDRMLSDRKQIYSKLLPVPDKIVKKASDKLLKRNDEEINKEFFD